MATAPSPSRRDVKQEHKRLRVLASDLQKKFEDARSDLNRFSDGYVKSEQQYPWVRLKILHDLIQSITSASFVSNIQRCVEESNIVSEQPRASIPALLTKIDAINALKSKKKSANQAQGQGEGENRPLIESKKDRTKGVMGKIRKLTGFDNRPIEDEDVMSTERLHFCVGTLEKRIQTLHNEFTSLLAAIKTLQSDYSTVRTQCSCSKYFSLKRIIEAAIEQTDAEAHYEFHP